MTLSRGAMASALRKSCCYQMDPGKLNQAGYDFGLDQALIPSRSALWVPISIPSDFKYVDDPEVEVDGEEEEKDKEASQAGGDGEERNISAGGGEGGGATTGNDVEHTSNHDPAIQLNQAPYPFSPLVFLFLLYWTSLLLQSLNLF